jgi:NAD(P)H-hydrate repair Nnr-like enzyme with NAD(P)H-hydrate epimerase domain
MIEQPCAEHLEFVDVPSGHHIETVTEDFAANTGFTSGTWTVAKVTISLVAANRAEAQDNVSKLVPWRSVTPP